MLYAYAADISCDRRCGGGLVSTVSEACDTREPQNVAVDHRKGPRRRGDALHAAIFEATLEELTAVGYAELTSVGYNLESETFKATEIFIVLGVTYLAVVWTLSALIRLLEVRLALPEGSR